MDKSYKKLLKSEKKLEKQTRKVLDKDKGRDRLFDREKKKLKDCKC